MGLGKLIVKDKLERPQAKLCVTKNPGYFGGNMLIVKKNDTDHNPVVVPTN